MIGGCGGGAAPRAPLPVNVKEVAFEWSHGAGDGTACATPNKRQVLVMVAFALSHVPPRRGGAADSRRVPHF
ncbi:hypothetical protein NL676_036573 [Syzygium grande]|nr:hypothetical protein NL676_036573 [Syzygium grande]